MCNYLVLGDEANRLLKMTRSYQYLIVQLWNPFCDAAAVVGFETFHPYVVQQICYQKTLYGILYDICLQQRIFDTHS